MAKELRAKDFAAAGFGELELIEDDRRWSWMLERSFIVPFMSVFLASVIVLMMLSGAMSFHRDPLNAMAQRGAGAEAPLDTSWSVEFHVVPDYPIGIELRKLGPDESLRLYEPRN